MLNILTLNNKFSNNASAWLAALSTAQCKRIFVQPKAGVIIVPETPDMDKAEIALIHDCGFKEIRLYNSFFQFEEKISLLKVSPETEVVDEEALKLCFEQIPDQFSQVAKQSIAFFLRQLLHEAEKNKV